MPDRTIFDSVRISIPSSCPAGSAFSTYSTTRRSATGCEDQHSRRISAICNGVFALGSAGLIDHRRSPRTGWTRHLPPWPLFEGRAGRSMFRTEAFHHRRRNGGYRSFAGHDRSRFRAANGARRGQISHRLFAPSGGQSQFSPCSKPKPRPIHRFSWSSSTCSTIYMRPYPHLGRRAGEYEFAQSVARVRTECGISL